MLCPSSISYAEDKKTCSDDPRLCFDGFKDDGSIITRDGEAEKTFSLPYVKAGFIVDISEMDVLPHVGMEVIGTKVPYVGDLSVDVGVAASRTILTLNWEFIPLVKAGPLIWVGYNVKLSSPAYGIGFSILDF